LDILAPSPGECVPPALPGYAYVFDGLFLRRNSYSILTLWKVSY